MSDPDAGIRDYRTRRATRAQQLRDSGLSTRQIGARLGVSHATVLEDLKVTQLDSIAGMTPAQINTAREGGRLATLMGEQLPAPEPEGDPT
jgi:hypothetical protein